jgi:hypothetical protein
MRPAPARDAPNEAKGVAFLKSVSALYEPASVSYVCLNLRHSKRADRYIHSLFSNRNIRQRTGDRRPGLEEHERYGLTGLAWHDWRGNARSAIPSARFRVFPSRSIRLTMKRLVSERHILAEYSQPHSPPERLRHE